MLRKGGRKDQRGKEGRGVKEPRIIAYINKEGLG